MESSCGQARPRGQTTRTPTTTHSSRRTAAGPSSTSRRTTGWSPASPTAIVWHMQNPGGTAGGPSLVTDLDTGAELSRTVIDGRFTWGGWEAPPVALDGDLVWVH